MDNSTTKHLISSIIVELEPCVKDPSSVKCCFPGLDNKWVFVVESPPLLQNIQKTSFVFYYNMYFYYL